MLFLGMPYDSTRCLVALICTVMVRGEFIKMHDREEYLGVENYKLARVRKPYAVDFKIKFNRMTAGAYIKYKDVLPVDIDKEDNATIDEHNDGVQFEFVLDPTGFFNIITRKKGVIHCMYLIDNRVKLGKCTNPGHRTLFELVKSLLRSRSYQEHLNVLAEGKKDIRYNPHDPLANTLEEATLEDRMVVLKPYHNRLLNRQLIKLDHDTEYKRVFFRHPVF